MCLTAYVDDSGSDPSAYEFVLGGVVMSAGQWRRWQDDWIGVLRAPPAVEYFKASEVWERNIAKESPFRLLSDEDRRRKVESLVDVTCEYQPKIFSCRIKWRAFERFSNDYALSSGKDSPYFWLYYGIITMCAYQVNHIEANPIPVDFVFDNQNKIGRRAKDYYHIFESSCSEEVQAVLGAEPKFDDERTAIPLQAADLVAWYRRKDSLDTLHSEWHQRIWNALDKFHISAIQEEDRLAAMARDLGVMLRP